MTDQKSALAEKWLSRVNEEPIILLLSFLNFKKNPANLVFFLVSFTVVSLLVRFSSGTVLGMLFMFLGAGSVALHILIQAFKRGGRVHKGNEEEKEMLRIACQTLASMQIAFGSFTSKLLTMRKEQPIPFYVLTVGGLYLASIVLDYVPTFLLFYVLVVTGCIYYSKVTPAALKTDLLGTFNRLRSKYGL